MKFYISPETKKNLDHKLAIMFRRLETQPQITYSDVSQMTKTTIIDFGWEGSKKYTNRIDAIEVNIEDIKTGEWVLVATVDYTIGKLLMCDSRYFKNIPAHYGLDYFKCDHCGSEHKNRNEAHILYNTVSGDWMQVGSTCVNKLINGGKYLNGLMIKLYEVFKAFGGCDEFGWYSGHWSPSPAYCRAAVKFEDALMICKYYMDTVSDVWKKVEYDGCTKIYGTNRALEDMVYQMTADDTIPAADKYFINPIKSYFDSIEYGEVYYEKNLTQKIKDAFTNEYIMAGEMYIAWFAINNYQSSLTKSSFEQQVDYYGIKAGKAFDFVGKVNKIEKIDIIDWAGYETWVWQATMTDEKTGMVFVKEIANKEVLNKFLGDDGKFRFTGTVKYIAWKRQYIGFGGRLKKTK